jgi:hypothetical protein
MKLGKIITDVRDDYLNGFTDSRSKISKEKRVIIEAAFRDGGGNLVEDGILNLPLRGDIFVMADNGSTESIRVDSKSLLKFQPFEFVWRNNLPVLVNPFFWDACDLRLQGIDLFANWQPLKNWFYKWFDSEDKNQSDKNGFNGVIHFLSDPVNKDSLVVFQVDLGSAPVQSLEDLLEVFSNLGVKEVEIGNPK